MQTNEAQSAAVMHLRGPCLVLAGPGSGKTFTITKRILYLLEHGVPPESILVITFTKEAALSMQSRFREMSGMAEQTRNITYPVVFGTFHSVFYQILRESNVIKSSRLLKNSEKKNLLLPILKSFDAQMQQKDSYEGLSDDAIQILSAISFYKNTMLLTNAQGKTPARWQSCFGEIFSMYEEAVKKTGSIDYDDMLYRCRQLLLENLSVREYWQNRFSHILIDEFQDINPVQYEIVKLLTAKPYNIFAVGDDDQAIYGFRGAEPDCMKRFETEFRARNLLLNINYRSSPEIVRASLAVIGENKNRFVKQLKAFSEQDRISDNKISERVSIRVTGISDIGTGNPFIIRPFVDKEEQYRYMICTIPGQMREGKSCAVLFRTNAYMQGFAARLKAADIPYEMREKAVSIYEHFIVEDVMAYLKAAQGGATREQMLRIMNRPSRYISREAVGEGNIDFGKMRKYYAQARIPDRQRKSVAQALLRFEKQLQSISGLSPLPAVKYILKAVGYERYLKERAASMPGKWQEWQEVLEWLMEDAARFASCKEWETCQKEYNEVMEQKEEQKTPVNSGKKLLQRGCQNVIQLLTVHGAKGLEFDSVWIPDCNEKIFPHGTMPDLKTVEEERRIFYVAMTRAKEKLEILYTTGTKERFRLPSRFLNPLS